MNDNICYFKFLASGVEVEEKYPFTSYNIEIKLPKNLFDQEGTICMTL